MDSHVPSALRNVQIHGFISQGGFKSTANNYLGHSKRGTLEFFEAGVNFSTEVADRLRAGMQLYARDLANLGNYSAKLDWAYLSYQWREWLGVRAGRIKLPFGLYNEYSDIDSARPFVLLPQSVYPVRNRDFLLAHTGLALFGSLPPGLAGALDYQVFLGTIYLDPGENRQINHIDTKYVAGGQLFWRSPVEGLRLGGSWVNMNLDFDFQLDAEASAGLVQAGTVPATFDGRVIYELPRVNMLVGSLEYVGQGFLVSAEYSRWLTKAESSIPSLLPYPKGDAERAYASVAYRFSAWLQVGTYYSLYFVDAGDRGGEQLNPMTGQPRFSTSHRARQRDLALCLRVDLNDSWLVKLEGHYVDGTAELTTGENPDPAKLKENWFFFAAKTTLSF